jgi:hypothetical protein
MNRFIILCISLMAFYTPFVGISQTWYSQFPATTEDSDSLPTVLNEHHKDLIEIKLRHEAAIRFSLNQLPGNLEEWESYRVNLKNEILKKAGVIIDHYLPLNIKETGSIEINGCTIKNIAFQTRPGIYATANLYIPQGKGPFPAVINMIGHWDKGKIDSTGPQGVGQSLALNGYVCLSIDPWGAGERATIHGEYEFHGSGLGSSILNIGESLFGIQISDNMRGVDLLCSLKFVDKDNIGATGASGGGNQTMWLSALDERIKAAVPVVSVGSFESYIMGTNCICEVLNDGLLFTEEAGVLALSRAIMPCNHIKDSNPTFLPSEMLRTYDNAKKIFVMRGEGDHLSYRIFDLEHDYLKEDREAMLGWFDYHLKGIGTGSDKKEVAFQQVPEDSLMVFKKGQRDKNVLSTDEYCRIRGMKLRTDYLNLKSFNLEKKRDELRDILRLNEKLDLKKVHKYSSLRSWERLVLETKDDQLIPLLHLAPANKSIGYVIICNSGGKDSISLSLIDEIKKKGSGIVIVDFSGTGELNIQDIHSFRDATHHNLARAELWLGKTILGEWIKELNLIVQYLKSNYDAQKVSFDGNKEAGLAGLFLSSLEGNIDDLVLRDAPVSYLFDNRESVNFFSTGIHLPGFLNWGDISLATALSGKNVTFINPLSISGRKVEGNRLKEFEVEFEKLRRICKQPGITRFTKS